MQDWVGLLIAFVIGFFAKHLLGTVCQSRLVEGSSTWQKAKNYWNTEVHPY